MMVVTMLQVYQAIATPLKTSGFVSPPPSPPYTPPPSPCTPSPRSVCQFFYFFSPSSSPSSSSSSSFSFTTLSALLSIPCLFSLLILPCSFQATSSRSVKVLAYLAVLLCQVSGTTNRSAAPHTRPMTAAKSNLTSGECYRVRDKAMIIDYTIF